MDNMRGSYSSSNNDIKKTTGKLVPLKFESIIMATSSTAHITIPLVLVGHKINIKIVDESGKTNEPDIQKVVVHNSKSGHVYMPKRLRGRHCIITVLDYPSTIEESST